MLVVATEAQLVSVDHETGNLIKSYKNCESQDISVSKYGILSTQVAKPLLLQFGKKETNVKKIVFPEKIAKIEVSPCGKYLACGAISGRLLLWSLESGQLLAAQDAHFQAVTCLAWSDDSAILTSGSADARLLVWRVFDLLSDETAEPQVLSGQSLEISDVKIGKGIWREARVFSASKDCTICVYNLSNLQRLTTLTLPDPVLRLCLDPAERAIYAATPAGVRVVSLYKLINGRLEAVGGLSSVVGCENAALLESDPSALALSADATHLYVGDKQGVVSTWDVGTKQLIRRNQAIKGTINNVVLGEFDLVELPAFTRALGEPSDIILGHAIDDSDINVVESDIYECWDGVAVNTSVQTSTAVPTADPASSKEIEALKKKNRELQALYDKLWAETS